MDSEVINCHDRWLLGGTAGEGTGGGEGRERQMQREQQDLLLVLLMMSVTMKMVVALPVVTMMMMMMMMMKMMMMMMMMMAECRRSTPLSILSDGRCYDGQPASYPVKMSEWRLLSTQPIAVTRRRSLMTSAATLYDWTQRDSR